MDDDATTGGDLAESAVGAMIADVLARTEDLAEVPIPEHVARFDAVHVALSDALSAIDGA